MPWIGQLALKGKCFIGGYGIEETDTDGEASLDDTKPTLMLKAPDSGTLVIPLFVRLQLTTEGGAAPDAYLSYVSTGTDTPISVTSGTDVGVLNCLGGTQTTKAATCQHTVTIGAVTDAQNNVIWQATALLDNLISVEMATGANPDGVSTQMSAVTIPLFPTIPLILNKGTMLNFYTATGTSDSKWRPTVVWAEESANIL